MNKPHVRTARAYALVHSNDTLYSTRIYETERNAKTRFSQSWALGQRQVLFKDQNEVRIVRLIPESVVEKALNRILEINQDNPSFAIEMVIDQLRSELK
jgi:hypothetical protein